MCIVYVIEIFLFEINGVFLIVECIVCYLCVVGYVV